jgi:hypothetical protein
MKNQSLQHDVAISTTHAIIDGLKDDLPFERRLEVMQLLYWSFKAGLEAYEERAERRDRRLCGPHTKASNN